MAGRLQDQIFLKKELADPLAQLQEAARRIARIQGESKLPVEEQEYIDSFRPGLMDVVLAWSKAGHTTYLSTCATHLRVGQCAHELGERATLH